MSLAQTEPAPESVCAVVVTFEPDDPSLACVRTVVEACAHTLIFDNGSSPERRAGLRRLCTDKVTLCQSESNTGVAAGFNLGIRRAAALGYRWFLLFDQDSRVGASTVPTVVRTYGACAAEIGEKLGFLACGYQQITEEGVIVDPPGEFRKAAAGKSWFPTDLAITSGTLLNLRNFEAIGPFREEFFIDHVDHEYCLRAQRMGYVIARTKDPLMVHRLGSLRYRRPLLALGKRKMLNYYSPLRRYYQLRNFLTLARGYEADFPSSIDSLRSSLHREIKRALKYEAHPFRVLISILLAWRDNRRGISGKYKGGIAL